MKSPIVNVPVALTEQEVQHLDGQAQRQGVSGVELRSYYLRIGAFGWQHAVASLSNGNPTPSQSGPDSEAEA